MLADAHRQGLTVRNVAEYVSHVAVRHADVDTYTPAEVQTILAAIGDDRIGHAWELALSGLRRGEVAGLRWSDVDLDAKTLTVTNNRVDAGGTVTETTRRLRHRGGRCRCRIGWCRCCGRPKHARRGNDWRSVTATGPTWCATRSANHTHRRCCPVAGAKLPRGRGARDQAARRPAYLRHVDAPVRRAHGGDRGMDRAQRSRP